MLKQTKKHLARINGMAILALFAITAFTSCTDDEVCEEATANELRIGFYVADQETETRAIFDSLTVFALERPDSLIYNKQNNVSVIELPLNPHNNESVFLLDFYYVTDTIRLTYTREEHLISVECGFAMFFNITDAQYSTNLILSLVKSNTYVTNTLDEHFKIYFPYIEPDPDDDDDDDDDEDDDEDNDDDDDDQPDA